MFHRPGVGLAALFSIVTFSAAADRQPPESAGLRVTVRDSRTGLAVEGASLQVAANGVASSRTSAPRFGGLMGLAAGEYAIVVSAPGYHPLSGVRASVSAGQQLPLVVWLDPDQAPREAEAPSLEAGQALLEGRVIDEASGQALGGVTVRLAHAGVATQTDARGWFTLVAQEARAARDLSDLPPVDDLVFAAEGYETVVRQGVPLLATTARFRIDMQRGQGETVIDTLHKMHKLAWGERLPTQSEGLDTAAPNASAQALPGPAAVQPPASIYVSGYGWYSLETYVALGLDDEWIASWDGQSLRAGAVAYRTYGSWWQVNQGYICATTGCQVFDPADSYAAVSTAAQATAGIVLQKDNAIAYSEYSAENNCSLCSGWSCVNQDLSCGPGQNGSPAAGWPCLSDAHSFIGYMGSCCFGHGHGMCQWGTQAWAAAGRDWVWMVNHYYNAEGTGSGNRTMYMSTSGGTDGSAYVSEGAPLDGTQVSANAVFSKRWTLRNSGSTTWSSASYRARRIAGAYGPLTIGLSGNVAPGANTDVTGSFTAPGTAGTYRATYQMEGPNGQFGTTFWVEIVVTSAGGSFSGLSGTLGCTSTFNFTATGLSGPYAVDLSTTPGMTTDVYLTFGSGNGSPVVVPNPTKWDKYTQGRTLYWRVWNNGRTVSSAIQALQVNCAGAGFTNLSGTLGCTSTFNFSYSGPATSYIVDLSTTSGMTTDVYLSFGVGSASPVTVPNPKKWDKYTLNRPLYWRVWNSARTLSSTIQAATVTCP